MELSTEACVQLLAAAVKQAEKDLVMFDPGDRQFRSARRFLQRGELLKMAFGSIPQRAVIAAEESINNARLKRGKEPVVVALRPVRG